MDAEGDEVSKDYKKIKDKTKQSQTPKQKRQRERFHTCGAWMVGREKGWKAHVLLVAKETGT